METEAKNTYEPYDLECDTFPEDTEILEEAFLLNCEIDWHQNIHAYLAEALDIDSKG